MDAGQRRLGRVSGGPGNGTGVAQSLAESACSTLAATKCSDPSTRTRGFTLEPAIKEPAEKGLPLVERMAGQLWLERFWVAVRLRFEPDFGPLP